MSTRAVSASNISGMVGVCPNLSLKAGHSNAEVVCITHTLDKIRKDASHLGDIAKANVHIGEHGAYAVATNRRFLVFSQSMTGKPKDLLGSWAVDGVSVETDVHRAGGLTRVESMRFVLPDHTMIAAECSERSHGDEADELGAALNQAA